MESNPSHAQYFQQLVAGKPGVENSNPQAVALATLIEELLNTVMVSEQGVQISAQA